MFSVQVIKDLIEWVASHRIRGIEVERSGFKLKIEGVAPPEAIPAPSHSSHSHGPSHQAPVSYSAQEPSQHSPSAAPGLPRQDSASEPPAGVAAPSEESEQGLHVINSPIVGTFYRASGPDQESFVKLGDHVTKGQTLCIVEAMKLMNEIEADVSGEIVRIFAQNIQPVEYGEKLFAIRPD